MDKVFADSVAEGAVIDDGLDVFEPVQTPRDEKVGCLSGEVGRFGGRVREFSVPLFTPCAACDDERESGELAERFEEVGQLIVGDKLATTIGTRFPVLAAAKF